MIAVGLALLLRWSWRSCFPSAALVGWTHDDNGRAAEHDGRERLRGAGPPDKRGRPARSTAGLLRRAAGPGGRRPGRRLDGVLPGRRLLVDSGGGRVPRGGGRP